MVTFGISLFALTRLKKTPLPCVLWTHRKLLLMAFFIIWFIFFIEHVEELNMSQILVIKYEPDLGFYDLVAKQATTAFRS
jgi:hypothetical protein